MRDVLNQWLGIQGGQVIQMIGALLVVVVLIVAFAWVMRRFGGAGRREPARHGERPTQRLAVVDAALVDGQRRLVLVRRDDVEHLVMIGGPNDVLIEPRIVRGQPLGGQRGAAPAVPYQAAAAVAQATAQPPHQQQPQQQPVRAAAPPPVAAPEPPPVPMPPPFVESVTSPAAPARANPIAADLRAAMGDGRRPDDLVDTQRDAQATRIAAPPVAAVRPPPYEEPTIVAGRAPYVAPPAAPTPAHAARPAPAPAPARPQAPSLEDMVAAGLEQAISRPDPVPTRPVTRTGPAFGQRVERPEPPAYDGRSPSKDAVAAEIEKAIYGLTAPGAGRPPVARPPVNIAPPRDAEPVRPAVRLDSARRAPEPTMPVGRLPQAAAPVYPRQPPAPARPTLVAQADAEPVVAQPEPVRADTRQDTGRRTSSDIEDEMARLLSELTGTAGR